METTAEQINRLEQELAALKEKERAEKEEAKKKADAERDADLLAIMNSIKVFNEKYGEDIALTTMASFKAGKSLYDIFSPWI
jgi:transcription elongation GreA/GreB family factor